MRAFILDNGKNVMPFEKGNSEWKPEKIEEKWSTLMQVSGGRLKTALTSIAPMARSPSKNGLIC